MRAPVPSFSDDIVAYREKHGNDPVLDRWEKNSEWNDCWKMLQEKLSPDVPTAEEFIWLVLFRRDVAKCFDEIKRGTPTAAEAKRRSKAYLRDKKGALHMRTPSLLMSTLRLPSLIR
jgi:hypothetical protein